MLLVSVSALAMLAARAVAQDHNQMDYSQHQTEPAPKTEAIDHSMMDHGEHPANHSRQKDYRTGCFSFGGTLLDEDGSGGQIDGTKWNPKEGSGTSRLLAHEGGMHGLHLNVAEDWMVMAHGYAWGVYTNQSGPRGDEKTHVQSMAMLSAERRFEGCQFQFKSMFSLEPLMSNRGYPNVFATGETANGEPLVDRQHPHDLFMELSARLDIDIA